MRERLRDRTSSPTQSSKHWAAFFGAVVFLLPISLQKLDYRNIVSGGLSISVHKSSPAFAALQDIREEYSDSLEELKTEPMTVIASGKTFNPRFLQQHPTQRVIALQGMTIRARPGFEPKPILVAGLVGAPKVEPPIEKVTVAATGEPQLTDVHGELLPLVERKRRLVELYKDEDLRQESVGDLARELVEQELRKSESGSVPTQYISSKTGTQILVAAEPPKSSWRENVKKITPPGLRLKLPLHAPAESGPTMSLVSYDTDSLRPLWLEGNIEMKDGLAFMGPETILTVKRVLQGRAIESGKILVREGTFEIRVKEAVGRLVAELATRNGELIGRGEVDLLGLDTKATKEDRLEGLKIAMRPTTEGTSIQVVSGYSSDKQNIPVAKAMVQIDAYTHPLPVDEEGRIFDRSLSRGSSFIARAEKSKFRPTMIVATSGVAAVAPIYNRTMLEALTSLSLDGADQRLAMREAIVWGRVSLEGKPVAGASVELVGNDRPIYFNEIYVPDRKLNVTTQNGMFSFLMVPEGVHAVRVRYNGRTYPAQIFPAAPETVSYMDLQLKEQVNTQFQVTDIFNAKNLLSAQIRVVGVDEELPIDNSGFVQYPACANPFVVEADAGPDYELARVMVNGTPDQAEIPVVKREWLTQLASSRGINLIPQRGVVMGVVEDQAFEIELSGYGPNENMDVVFFDSAGAPMEGSRGVAGGGFVVFNAPIGLQTLLIHPQYARESLSQIVVAEPAFVHMLKVNFSR